MKTTIFLTALYLLFGFFACKNSSDESVQSHGNDRNDRLEGIKVYTVPAYLPDIKDPGNISVQQSGPLKKSFSHFPGLKNVNDCLIIGLAVQPPLISANGKQGTQPVKDYVTMANTEGEQ